MTKQSDKPKKKLEKRYVIVAKIVKMKFKVPQIPGGSIVTMDDSASDRPKKHEVVDIFASKQDAALALDNIITKHRY